MATAEKKDTPATEPKRTASIHSTNAPRGAGEPASDAIAPDSGGAALQKAAQEKADHDTERGFIGQKADGTPRENYTLRGVGSGMKTPETVVRNADPLH